MIGKADCVDGKSLALIQGKTYLTHFHFMSMKHDKGAGRKTVLNKSSSECGIKFFVS